MNEEEAKAALNVPRETLQRLEAFVAMLREENQRQNLVSAASLDIIWTRHILDSAQLIAFAPEQTQSWLDLGTGAGFPGLIVALLQRSKVVMVESRKLRADFLDRAVALLGIEERATIVCAGIEKFEAAPFDVISARAFAPLDRIFTLAERFAATRTRWILPKGRNAKSELDAALASWQGGFRLEPSLTDPDARIIVAEAVCRKDKRSKAR